MWTSSIGWYSSELPMKQKNVDPPGAFDFFRKKNFISRPCCLEQIIILYWVHNAFKVSTKLHKNLQTLPRYCHEMKKVTCFRCCSYVIWTKVSEPRLLFFKCVSIRNLKIIVFYTEWVNIFLLWNIISTIISYIVT